VTAYSWSRQSKQTGGVRAANLALKDRIRKQREARFVVLLLCFCC
jgi:hypothetical protein